MRQFLSILMRSVTRQWIGVLALFLAFTQFSGAATYVTTTVAKLHITSTTGGAGGTTVIDSAGATVNLGQNMVLGSWATGDYTAGVTNQNLPFLGCTGSAVSSCAVSLFSDGISSAAQVAFDSVGNIYPNAATNSNIGVFIGGGPSIANVTCNNFFWGASSSFGSNSVPQACGDTSGNLGVHSISTAAASTVNGGRIMSCYVAGGTACATTWHVVQGSLSTSISGTCGSGLGACFVTGTVALTGTAQFSSAGSYTCNGTTTQNMVVNGTSGSTTASSIAFALLNTSGVTQTGNSITITYLCYGT